MQHLTRCLKYNYISRRFKTYLPTHEWLSDDKEQKFGITIKGLDLLGSIVYVENMAEKGEIINKGDEVIVLESVKASEMIVAPYNCEIVDNNINIDIDYLNENPECEEKSWFTKLKKIN